MSLGDFDPDIAHHLAVSPRAFDDALGCVALATTPLELLAMLDTLDGLVGQDVDDDICDEEVEP